jgi:hypothetical protein
LFPENLDKTGPFLGFKQKKNVFFRLGDDRTYGVQPIFVLPGKFVGLAKKGAGTKKKDQMNDKDLFHL